MGGNNIRDIHMALKRIITLRDDELLQDRDWIHFLGTSKLEWAVMLTSIQRQIRKHINPNITVSFDCASPYISSANGLVYTRNKITSEQITQCWLQLVASRPYFFALFLDFQDKLL